MEKIGVIGSGTMGIGIAQVAAASGCEVFLYDANAEQTQKSLQNLENILQKLASREKISFEEAEVVFNRIHFCTELRELYASELVIEAIVENREIKQKVFSELENIVSEDCILASNTSSISITSLSSGLKFPGRFIGLHFFNPAPLMPLVEIIPGLLTEKSLAGILAEFMKTWKKSPVVVKDIPGFIVNRIARPFYGEALRIVEENLATPEQVDDAMRSRGNFRMGPFELMDLIGIDINFAVTMTVFKDYYYDPKYKPSLLQQRMAEAGLLGRKTGKGFFDYSERSQKPIPKKDEKLYETVFLRIISMLVNEAVEAKRLKIASDEDLELAMQKGVNYPKGLLAWGNEIGFEKISETLQNLYGEYQEERYRQSPLLRKI